MTDTPKKDSVAKIIAGKFDHYILRRDDNPRGPGAWNNLAVALLGAGRGEDAAKVCAEAAEVFASSDDAWLKDAPICRKMLE